MSAVLLAEFTHADALLNAARGARERDLRLIDAFSPFRVEGLAELLGAASSRIRVAMFLGGITVAAVLYFTEWYTATIDYPINSGGRPLNSWPAFMMPPFATGIFGAAVVGLIFLFFATGLPRLHHPLFAIEGFERATQNHFVLAVARPSAAADDAAARAFLGAHGAIRVWEAVP